MMIPHTIECNLCHAQMHMNIHNPGTKEAKEDIAAIAEENGFEYLLGYEPEGGFSAIDLQPLGNEVMVGHFYCKGHNHQVIK